MKRTCSGCLYLACLIQISDLIWGFGRDYAKTRQNKLIFIRKKFQALNKHTMKYFARCRYAAALCPVSRVRRIKSMVSEKSLDAEYLRALQEMSEWSHQFWYANNLKFDEYMKLNSHDEHALGTYLKDNAQIFKQYTFEYYKRNFELSLLHLKSTVLHCKRFIFKSLFT